MDDLDLDSLKNVMRVLGYNDPAKENANKLDKVVDPALAQACIDDYKVLYTSTSNGAILKAYTSWVGFGSPELLKWLGEVCKPGVTDTDNLKIWFGVYNIRMMGAYPEIADHLNRLTVFIWPYCGDKKATYLKTANATRGGGDVAPYNIGSLYP